MPNYTTNKTIAQLDSVLEPVAATDLMLVSRASETFNASMASLRNWIYSGGIEAALTSTLTTDVAIVRRGQVAAEVGLANLLPGLSVTASKLQDGSVTETKLQSSPTDDSQRAVGRNHIKARAIGDEQLDHPVSAAPTDSNQVRPVQEKHLADNAVGSRSLKPRAVGSTNIATEAVLSTHFGRGVTGGHPAGDLDACVHFLNSAPDGTTRWFGQQEGAFFTQLRSNLELTASRNRSFPVVGRSRAAAPTFPGGSTLTAGFGGAFSGGVLLPDGRVFLVPFNYTEAMIYDPRKDVLVSAPTPENGTYPNTGALFAGGVLMADYSVSAGDTLDSASYNYTRIPQVAVVCVPYNSKRALLYYPYENRSVWTNEVASLPNRAFVGGVMLPSTRKFSGHRSAFLAPNASVNPAIVRMDGTLEVLTGLNKGTYLTRGASLTSQGDVFFGAHVYQSGTGALALGGYNGSQQLNLSPTPSEPQSHFRAAPLLNARGEILIPLVDLSSPTTLKIEVFSSDAQQLLRTAVSIPVSTVEDYSGMVRLPDGFVVLIPGRAQFPRIFDADAYDSTASIQLPGFPTPPTTQDGFGKGAYAGGVLLPDGRVFCVPCTATKAMIITPRASCAPFGWDILLSPHFNKR